MATASVYDFVRMSCTPLQNSNSATTDEKLVFYSYRGPGAAQFPNLRAADTDADDQLDFVIGVSNANYRNFLKLDGRMFAPGSQNNYSLWGGPVEVTRSALQLHCQTFGDARAIYFLELGVVILTGGAMLAGSAAQAVVMSATAVGPGLLVLAGLLVIHGGLLFFGYNLDDLQGRFYRSLDHLFNAALTMSAGSGSRPGPS